MAPLLVRLNLPDFKSPELFRLASAPPSVAELTCSVLQQIGGFSQDELDGVRHNLDSVPLQIHGELCAGQLVHLSNDAELEVFLKTASSNSPRGLATVEVRPCSAGVQTAGVDSPTRAEASGITMARSNNSNGGFANGDISADTDVGRSGQFDTINVLQDGAASEAGSSPDGKQLRRQAPPAGKSSSLVHSQNSTLRRGVQPVTSSRPARAHSGSRRVGIPLSTPPGERKLPWEASGSTRERPEKSALPLSNGPLPNGLERLYRDADERKMRLDEARTRHCKEEQEQLLTAKQQALGRASLSRSSSEVLVASASQQRRALSPERSQNGSAVSRNRSKDTSMTRGSYLGTYAPSGQDVEGMASPSPLPDDVARWQSASVDASPSLSLCSSVPPPSPGVVRTLRKAGGPVDLAVASDANQRNGNGLNAADVASEDLNELRNRAEAQQQRIEFLESMNQQSLRQLRRAREETAQAQQQRFQEADKVLSLEHLVSEMQSLCFQDAATPWCQDWLRRSAAILSDKSD